MAPRTNSDALLRDLHQTKPFGSMSEEATVALFRTTDLVKRGVAAVVAERGITLAQYNVLRILRGAGRSGLPTLAIAERLVEQAPGITRLVDQLESDGWLRRERSTEDRRRVYCLLTAKGRKLVNSLDKPVASHSETSFAVLSDREMRALLRTLEKIRDGLQRTE